MHKRRNDRIIVSNFLLTTVLSQLARFTGRWSEMPVQIGKLAVNRHDVTVLDSPAIPRLGYLGRAVRTSMPIVRASVVIGRTRRKPAVCSISEPVNHRNGVTLLISMPANTDAETTQCNGRLLSAASSDGRWLKNIPHLSWPSYAVCNGACVCRLALSAVSPWCWWLRTLSVVHVFVDSSVIPSVKWSYKSAERTNPVHFSFFPIERFSAFLICVMRL